MFIKPVEESMVWWHKGIVTKIVDADTIDVELDRSFNQFQRNARLRLAFINAPERYTDEGKLATAFVKEICPVGSDVMIYSHKDETGKYGRIVAEVICEGVNVNREILDNNHANLVTY